MVSHGPATQNILLPIIVIVVVAHTIKGTWKKQF